MTKVELGRCVRILLPSDTRGHVILTHRIVAVSFRCDVRTISFVRFLIYAGGLCSRAYSWILDENRHIGFRSYP